jgi:hypothetical protein
MLGSFVQLAIDSAALGQSAADTAIRENNELQALTTSTLPLHGADKRVADTGKQIDDFYAQRIPANYSSIATRLGELEVQSGVQLSHVEYSQKSRDPEPTEILINSGVIGEYPEIMRFVNGLERDQILFVIRSMTFQGQQGGQVNLQLSVSTWLRPADVKASSMPIAPEKPDISSVDRRH